MNHNLEKTNHFQLLTLTTPSKVKGKNKKITQAMNV